MSKKQQGMIVLKATKPEAIGALVQSSGMEIVKHPPKVGRIGKSKLVDAETMKALRKEVQILASEIHAHYEALGAVLDDDDNLGWEAQQIADEELQLKEAVFGTTEGKPREVVALASAQAMLTYFPQTPIGLNHFGDHGLNIGFFKPWVPGSMKYYVELPIGPKRTWTQLYSDIPNAINVLMPLMSISQMVRGMETVYNQERLASFEEQAKSFLDVLAAKEGQTVGRITVMDADNKLRLHQYVQITITISDNWISADDAIGTEQTLALIGSGIPIDAIQKINDPTYRFSSRVTRGMTPKQISTMYEFRRFLTKAINRAQQHAPRGKAKPTPALPLPQSDPASAVEN